MRLIEADPDGAIVQLTRDELLTIANALPIVRGQGPRGYGIPDWEFHTLIGVSPEQADALGDQIRGLLGSN